MSHAPLPDIVILLAIAVLAVALFRALRLSPVLGYLVAGTLIGSGGFDMLADIQNTAAIAELGVVLLLFLIGLDLSWDRLKTLRKKIFGIGGTQMLLTSALLSAILLGLGLSTTQALIVGAGLALSSTALVLEVLHERREMATQTGRMSLAILILQDLAVLPLLVLVPVVTAQQDGASIHVGLIILQAIAALIIIFVLGRLFLRPIFRVIARLDINELFVATTLLTVLGISWITNQAGLSPALGAFLAGLLLAETEFVHQIEADVKPFKGLLMGLFFMTVGMHINVEYLLMNVVWIFLAAFALIACKATLLYGVLRAFGYARRSSGHTALLLAQGGEFGFILFGLAAQSGLISAEVAEPLLVIIALTMALTPVLDTVGARFERRWQLHHRPTTAEISSETRDMAGHVVLAGYGAMGEAIAQVLEKEKIPFIALDIEPRRVQAGRRNHHPVYFGDASRHDVLGALGAERAGMVVLTMRNEALVKRSLHLLRSHFPEKPILVRAANVKGAHALCAAGATSALPELHLSSMRVVSMLLGQLHWPEQEISRVMRDMRGEAELEIPKIGV